MTPPVIKRAGRLPAVLAMGFGGVLTLGLMAIMNGNLVAPPKPDNTAEVQFDAPPPQKKAKPKPKPRPKPKPKPQRTPPPPMPNLAAGLAGLSFGLPGLSGALGDATDALLGDVGDVVMTEDSVDSPPQPMSRVAPSFPSRARSKGITGYVTVSMLVGPDGSVQDMSVLEATPSGVFEESAMAALRQWRFQPATYEGRNVATRVRQTLRFELE